MENRNILKKFQNSNVLYVIGIIFLAAFSRLIPHPPNVAPIAGLALFSGAQLDKRTAFIVPLTAMFLSDMVLGFHSTMPYVYFSFFIIVITGRVLLKNKKITNLIVSSLFASILFFLVTNFGVWLNSGMYIKNFGGLIQAYYLGLPFFRNTIIGDLIYTFSIFYGYEFSLIVGKKFLPSLKTQD